MGTTRRVALFLTHMDEAQQGWAERARAEARAASLELLEFWCETESARQNRQISECIWKDVADALLILPANLGGPAALLPQAVSRGKAVVMLDRSANDMNNDVAWSLPRLRREHPATLVARIAPDEQAIGRIQAQQARALLPAGGSLLYVQGDMMTAGAVERARAFEQLLAESSAYSIGKVDGGWSSERAEAAVCDWLRLVLIETRFHLDLVVSQSDVMLPGVRTGLSRMARERDRPDVARVRLTGCDGLAAFKQEVRDGLLAATVEVPARTPPAIKLVADFWTSGRMPAELEVALRPSSFPALESLMPSSGTKPA